MKLRVRNANTKPFSRNLDIQEEKRRFFIEQTLIRHVFYSRNIQNVSNLQFVTGRVWSQAMKAQREKNKQHF